MYASGMSATVNLAVDYLELAQEQAANPDEWPLAPRFDPVKRWYHRLAEGHGYEVWLLSWLPGQSTDWHDHGGSAGAFTVVTGELVEHTVEGEQPAARQSLRHGQGRRFGPHHVHRIVNEGRAPAVSIHVYGPALQTMTRYRLEANELKVQSVDKVGEQW